MFLIREASPSDIDQIFEAARHLDTVNLPADRSVLERVLEHSRKSFAGEVGVWQREYVFALEDVDARRIIGTSTIYAQHGTRKAPHVFFEVLEEERYSETLDRHFVHQALRIGYNYNGPTEIGGLILLPEYRRRPEGLGRFLSYVRFLYIALHRDRFRDEVLSELLPPLEPDGTSRLWESLGRHFTGLTYQEADRLSKENKEFIRALFPQGLLYTIMFPEATRTAIGQVGPQTTGVEKMLRAVGFEYAHRIDPFDGGPHFAARTDDITLVRDTKRMKVASGPDAGAGPFAMVSTDRKDAPHFLATVTPHKIEGDVITLPASALDLLGVSAGDEVGVLVAPAVPR